MFVLSVPFFSYAVEGRERIMELKKCALVTGASSGIGKALAVELLNRGYEVIGVSRSKENLDQVKHELNNPHLHIYACDVADMSAVETISSELKSQGYIPNMFFLNAGVAGEAAMEPTDVLDTQCHRKIFEVNYYGVLNFIEQWFVTCKEKSGATFIVSSSINAIFAPPGGSAYSASKAAISKAFDGLRITHAGSNIKFISVFCGPVDTPGLAGKLPFTWAPEKMAKYIVDRAEKGTVHSHPSWFYSSLAKFLNLLSENKVMWVLKLLTGNKPQE